MRANAARPERTPCTVPGVESQKWERTGQRRIEEQTHLQSSTSSSHHPRGTCVRWNHCVRNLIDWPRASVTLVSVLVLEREGRREEVL